MADSLLGAVIEELKAHTTLSPVESYNAASNWLRYRSAANMPDRDARQIAAEIAERRGLRWVEVKGGAK